MAAQKDGLATPEFGRGAGINHDPRHFHETRFDAAQGLGAGGGILQLLQNHRVRFVEWPDPRAPQCADMAVTAKTSAEVAGDRAHIGALAAARFEHRLFGQGIYEIEGADRHRTRGQLRRLATTRQIVGALAIDLDRRIGWRQLLDRPGKPRQQREDAGGGGPRVRLRGNVAVGIVSVGFNAPAHRKAIDFFAILNERHGFCCLAKSYRQNPRGERVERSGVSSLLGVEKTFQPGYRMGRGHAGRFVEHDPAMNVVSSRCADLHSGLSCFLLKSRFTSGNSNNASILAPYSKLGSALKRISGANLRLMRRAISPRKTFLCRSSAARTSATPVPPSGMTKIVASFRSGLMRTSGIVIALLSRTGSPIAERTKSSAMVWRISSATRSIRCEGSPPCCW